MIFNNRRPSNVTEHAPPRRSPLPGCERHPEASVVLSVRAAPDRQVHPDSTAVRRARAHLQPARPGSLRPAVPQSRLIREALADDTSIVVIDEIQKMPELLNEVQLMIERHGIRFLLTGSSARSLRRKGVNLLGGRAWSRSLHPFVRIELRERFDLNRALEYGLLPPVFFPVRLVPAGGPGRLRGRLSQGRDRRRGGGPQHRRIQPVSGDRGARARGADQLLRHGRRRPGARVDRTRVLPDPAGHVHRPRGAGLDREPETQGDLHLEVLSVRHRARPPPAGTAGAGAGNRRVRQCLRELRFSGDQGVLRLSPARSPPVLAIEVPVRGGFRLRGPCASRSRRRRT